jgi:nicotinamide-nucleotide amidase
MTTLAEEIGRLLLQKRLTLATVESATGGLIAHLITNVPGSSAYYRGSVIAYANETKTSVVGVNQDSIRLYGAVSREVAEEMAAGGKRLLKSDICLADTGIAGPGGAVPGKPLGLFFIGLAHNDIILFRKHTFQGTRAQNKLSAAGASLTWLRDYLKALP